MKPICIIIIIIIIQNVSLLVELQKAEQVQELPPEAQRGNTVTAAVNVVKEKIRKSKTLVLTATRVWQPWDLGHGFQVYDSTRSGRTWVNGCCYLESKSSKSIPHSPVEGVLCTGRTGLFQRSC